MCENIDDNLSIEEQIELIKSKGFKINDEEKIYDFLLYNGYYRINRYLKRMIDFNYALNDTELYSIYDDDNSLRSILFKYISIIEIRLRGVLNDYYSNNINQYLSPYDKSIYHAKSRYKTLQKGIDKELNYDKSFEFKKKIKLYKKAKVWMILEIITISTLSKFYSSLKTIRLEVIINKVSTIGIVKSFLNNIRSIVDLRNACAHQDLLFKNRIASLPKINKLKQVEGIESDSMYYVVMNLTFFLSDEYIELLEKDLKQVNLQNYDFPKNWSSF